MRLLLLSHHYAPEVGAPQRRWGALVARAVARGHDVVVVTAVPHYPQGRARPGAPRGRARGEHGETVVRVRYVPYDSGRGRRLLDQVVVAAAGLVPALRSRPDVVVATVPGMPTLLVGAVVAGLLRVPLVVEMRDAWPDLVEDARLGPAWLRRGLVAGVTALQRRAAAVVCVSDRFAGRLRARGLGRVVHVPNGVDLREVPVPAPPAPAPGGGRGAGCGPLRVLYAGTVGESQGLDRAVEALAHLRPGTVRLTVVGHGAGLPAVGRAVARLPRPADVRLLPPVPREEVADLVAGSDTALVCLRGWPAFEATVPSKLYELMALQVHVSAAVRGEAADVVRDAGAGDVVPPEDPVALAALWTALAADRTRLDVGPGPRAWVAAHADADVLAGTYLDLLGSLVEGTP